MAIGGVTQHISKLHVPMHYTCTDRAASPSHFAHGNRGGDSAGSSFFSSAMLILMKLNDWVYLVDQESLEACRAFMPGRDCPATGFNPFNRVSDERHSRQANCPACRKHRTSPMWLQLDPCSPCPLLWSSGMAAYPTYPIIPLFGPFPLKADASPRELHTFLSPLQAWFACPYRPASRKAKRETKLRSAREEGHVTSEHEQTPQTVGSKC